MVISSDLLLQKIYQTQVTPLSPTAGRRLHNEICQVVQQTLINLRSLTLDQIPYSDIQLDSEDIESVSNRKFQIWQLARICLDEK